MSTLHRCAPTINPGSPRLYAPPATSYLATAGTDVIDEGGPLEPFVADLLETATPYGRELAVWALREDSPARLVAVIRPGRFGVPAVTYL